jgi:hypothetical protein
MLKLYNIITPTCNRTFQKWLNTRSDFKYIYNLIGKPRPHDITLNAGIKKMPKEEREQFEKIDDHMLVYKQIVDKYYPETIDICYNGNNNNFDEFNILYNNANKYLEDTNNENNITNFTYVPFEKKYENYSFNIGTNVSFKTSFSNSFQKMSTGLSTLDTLKVIEAIIKTTDNNVHNIPVIQSNKYKLYYSCFDCCPVDGFIWPENIVKTMVSNKRYLNKSPYISLVDTTGTLYFKSIFEVIERIKYANSNGDYDLSVNDIALQLTYRPGEEHKLYKKFEEAIKVNANKFEVSMFKNDFSGNLLLNNEIVPGNMTYDMYYDFLSYYIVSKLD